MSLEQQIKAAKRCHEHHTVNVEEFKQRVFEKLAKQKEWQARTSWAASNKKQTLKKLAVVTTATAASFGVVIGVGMMTSPSFAQKLKQIPIVQSVFTMVGGDGLKKAHEQGLVSDIQKTATDQGITVTITEVFYDGSQISVGYILESSDTLPDLLRQTKAIKINGETPESWGTGSASHHIDDHKAVGVIDFRIHQPLPETLPDTFQFDLTFLEIGNIKGEWPFSLQIVKNDSSNQQIIPMQTKTYGDTTLLLEKVTFTVNSTELTGQIIQPRGSQSTIPEMFDVFEVTDDKGNQWGLLGSSREERKTDGENEIIRWNAVYQPAAELPEAITVRPATLEKRNLPADIVRGLEITVPIQKTSN